MVSLFGLAWFHLTLRAKSEKLVSQGQLGTCQTFSVLQPRCNHLYFGYYMTACPLSSHTSSHLPDVELPQQYYVVQQNEAPSAYLHSWISKCRVLDECAYAQVTLNGKLLSSEQKNTVHPPQSIDRIYRVMPCPDSDINALGKSIIVLSSYKVATDLFEDRSSNYSRLEHPFVR